ncbi:MAG: hypothetical protein FJ104_04710, partial [Deltaproteobacteria bacterium]|nr:hypothetical protein [Deltaproteobacteria bacterium]
MNSDARLHSLAKNHDWSGLLEALEAALADSTVASEQADLHLELGRLLQGRFLQGAKALKHFQDAFKLNPALVVALGEARGVYWLLGRLNMVQKLLELQLKHTEGPGASPLFRELGDVLSDVGDQDRATEAYARALQTAAGQPTDAGERLHDVQLGDAEWQEQVAFLLRSAREATDAVQRAQCFLRAARITGRFAPDELEGMLGQAYAADSRNLEVAALYEELLTKSGRSDALLSAQREILGALAEDESAALAVEFGTRWALRHQNHDIAARLMEEAVRAAP